MYYDINKNVAVIDKQVIFSFAKIPKVYRGLILPMITPSNKVLPETLSKETDNEQKLRGFAYLFLQNMMYIMVIR